MGYPEVAEEIVCEKAAFKARGKGFLFLGSDDSFCNALLKLGASLPEAARLAAGMPSCYKVGGHNWVTATFRHDRAPPRGLMERWIDESYRLLAPKQLVALLPERAQPAADKAKAAKRKAPKKKTARKQAATR